MHPPDLAIPASPAAADSGAAVSLRSLAIRGSVWTILGYAGGQALRLAGNLVLTRLLFPEAFGLMALVQVFMQGLAMFSDIGIGPSIIQNKRGDDPRFLNTAWTIQVGRGVILSLCALLLAWPVARFYGEPQLASLLPVAGLSALVAGFNSTRVFTCNRRLALGRLTVVELLAQAIGLTITVLWAWHSRTVWSLVGGGLIGAAVKTVLTYVLLPGERNGFCWDRESLQALVRFGRWIFVSTVLTFLAMQADRLILGKLLSLEMLGVYSIAFFLSDAPRQVSKVLSAKVAFPAISRRVDLPRETLREKLLVQRKPVLYIAMAVTVVLVVTGDLFVHGLYDDRYALAAPMLPILALGLWPRMLDQSLSPALMAIGALQYNPLGSMLRLLLVAIGVLIAFQWWGVLGAVIVIALGDVPNYLADLYGLFRHRLQGLRQDLAMTGVAAVVGAVFIAIRLACGWGHPFDAVELLLPT